MGLRVALRGFFGVLLLSFSIQAAVPELCRQALGKSSLTARQRFLEWMRWEIQVPECPYLTGDKARDAQAKQRYLEAYQKWIVALLAPTLSLEENLAIVAQVKEVLEKNPSQDLYRKMLWDPKVQRAHAQVVFYYPWDYKTLVKLSPIMPVFAPFYP